MEGSDHEFSDLEDVDEDDSKDELEDHLVSLTPVWTQIQTLTQQLLLLSGLQH